MVKRIGKLIRAGELDNTVNNTVHGWLHFWDHRHPVLLNLTGNCGRGLRGRRLRFRMNSWRSGHPTSRRCLRPRSKLQAQQIGPVGKMRFAPSEMRGQEAWRMRLQLEWFSQDGRIIVDLWEPSVEFILRPQMPDRSHHHKDSFANLLSIDGSDIEFCEQACGTAEDGQCLPTSAAAHESYWRLINDVASGARDVPLSSLFDPPLRLMPADQISDRDLAKALRNVLARLARHGIAIDVCRHFSKRQTYRWLLDEILPGEEIFPDLPRLGYVMHYMTSEHCSLCAKG